MMDQVSDWEQVRSYSATDVRRSVTSEDTFVDPVFFICCLFLCKLRQDSRTRLLNLFLQFFLLSETSLTFDPLDT